MTLKTRITAHTPTRPKARKTIGLIDYEVGNLGSLTGALTRLGYRVIVGNTADTLRDVDCLLMPGVGSMPYAMDALRRGGLDQFIQDSYAAGTRRIIGICLGMQLMFESSDEGGVSALGILPGRVRKLADNTCHVGWNICRSSGSTSCLTQETAYYFNHSFYVECPSAFITATTQIENANGDSLSLPAIVQSGPFIGLQFHPEKSQVAGASLLTALIEGEVSHA